MTNITSAFAIWMTNTETLDISRLFWERGVPASLGDEAEDDFAVAAGIVAELGFGRSQSANTNVFKETII